MSYEDKIQAVTYIPVCVNISNYLWVQQQLILALRSICILFPFGILFVYVLLRNLCFFCHSHLFSCTFVFSFKIQSIHCLLKERLLRIPSPGLSNLLFGPTSILIYLFIYLFHCIFCMVLLLVGEGNGTPPQYSCLENPRDGRAWQATVHGVAKSRTQLSNFTTTTTWY